MFVQSALVAQFTPHGRGAVATIAFRGDVAAIDAAGQFVAANGKLLADQAINRLAFGRWGSDPGEDVVVCRIADDRLEIHCHGGEAAAGRILAQCESIGAVRLAWKDFLERADGPFTAEIAAALAAATTPRTAAIIARQAAGPLRETLSRLSRVDIIRDRAAMLEELHRLDLWSAFGRHLTQPWQVVLYGPPNVGKSSLINALVGFERSIVFDRPGTTRDVVTAETAFDGWPLRFSDTAGLRTTTGELEAAGIERAKAALVDADLRLLVLDRSQTSDPHLEAEFRRLGPGLIVLNKSDLSDGRDEEANAERMVAVSAKTGEGVRDLLIRITELLVPDVPTDDEPVPVTPRQIEAIRTAIAAVESGDEASYRAAIADVSQ